jgi:uncharacterized phage protein gp47/JayE
MTYIGVPVTTDPDALAAAAWAYLQEQIPGLVPNDNSLLGHTIASWAQMLATSRDVASIVPDQIFEYYGSTLQNIVPIAAASSTVQATITAQDNAGYTIPAGTQFGFPRTGSDTVVFTNLADIVIPPGSTTAMGVTLTALIPGYGTNGLTGAMIAVTPLAFITAVAATTDAAGGVDGETSDAYLGRLVETLQLSTPRPVRASDFAVLAHTIAGVYRALGIDNYNPADGTTDNERMVAISAVDIDGNAVSGTIQANIISYLESLREINFIVNWVDPTYTVINVVYSVHLTSGAVWAAVEADVDAAIRSYLSQATWGGGGTVPPGWDPASTTARYLQLAGIIEAVAGVDYVVTLTLNGVAGDIPLTGVAPLANYGTISGSAA